MRGVEPFPRSDRVSHLNAVCMVKLSMTIRADANTLLYLCIKLVVWYAHIAANMIFLLFRVYVVEINGAKPCFATDYARTFAVCNALRIALLLKCNRVASIFSIIGFARFLVAFFAFWVIYR